ncbi:MAG: hypothetical protein WBI34_04210 [Tenuifilaceae bacterium]|jgi:hypothetical protein|nr:hypothetical protein [Bacteroidales bacterium]MDI9515418.1 hypothetical protein [Bacteroidota bacterium]NLH57635.1 hypothetical protein [Rikenellaceae bacterium]OQC63077.1 MAG: hypothetical protein BWX49_01400 [Bacteroidetes bacterium ADurb.Bin008]HNV82366.1 hypothetical protein [Tenuifilaceae bacterium]
MDFGTLLIGIGALAVMIVPIILIQISNKRKATQKLEGLLDHARLSGINVTSYDIWNEKLIGLDGNSKKLILFTSINDQSTLKVFNLSEYQSCSVKVDRKGSKSKDNPNLPIERISLCLKTNNPNGVDESVSFYDATLNMTVNNELALAEKWEKVVKKNLTK